VLKFLYQKEFQRMSKTITYAAINNGHLHIMQWLHNNGCILDHYIFSHAIMVGNLNVLQWLDENGCPRYVTTTCMNTAISCRNLNVVRWLHERGYLLFEHTFKVAVQYGSLEIVQWLYENGCPMNRDLTSYTIYNLEVYRYLMAKVYYDEEISQTSKVI
jgi:hypothetical protein